MEVVGEGGVPSASTDHFPPNQGVIRNRGGYAGVERRGAQGGTCPPIPNFGGGAQMALCPQSKLDEASDFLETSLTL